MNAAATPAELEQDRPADLVFEGGGVKGVGLAGAYRALWDRGFRPRCVAGTSAGAITAALVAAGYTGPELEDIVLGEMLEQLPAFEDPTFLDHLGLPGESLQFLISRGLHSGDYFLHWMARLLESKGKVTFGDLRGEDAGTEPNRVYRLQVVASDLSARRMLVLPRDSEEHLGVEPDELPIAEAVRMSMSIPIFFQPVIKRGRGGRHVIVDGGLLSNYPVWLFDSQGRRPRFPTFGMLLVAPGQKAPLLPDPAPGDSLAPAQSNLAFLKSIVETMLEAHDRLYVEEENYVRTIPIPTLGVKTTDFTLSRPRARQLFESGKEAADSFLDTWDFGHYVEKFRSGTARPSRRDRLLRDP
jgi:NTE family protein